MVRHVRPVRTRGRARRQGTERAEPKAAGDGIGMGGTGVPRVLVVDDEPSITELVAYNLRQEGFAVDCAADGRAALRMAEAAPYDLVVLDLMLPVVDGREVLRLLRRDHDTPVILLTARGGEADRVAGLEAGADDYLVKPFSVRELLARVHAVLRRFGRGVGKVRVGGVEIDPAQRRAVRDGRPVELTQTEFDLFWELAQSAGRVLDRESLIRRVWGYDFEGDRRTVDVHVRHLREKLEADPARPRLIETVRGVGYRLRAET
jgi:DNA-binding response OmpR family regulator